MHLTHANIKCKIVSYRLLWSEWPGPSQTEMILSLRTQLRQFKHPTAPKICFWEFPVKVLLPARFSKMVPISSACSLTAVGGGKKDTKKQVSLKNTHTILRCLPAAVNRNAAVLNNESGGNWFKITISFVFYASTAVPFFFNG